MTSIYRLYPVTTSPAFRELVRDTYPALDDPEHGYANWRMMEFIFFSTFGDKGSPGDEDTTEDGHTVADGPTPERLVLPHEMVAAMEGQHSKARGFTSRESIERFSRDVLPLDVKEFRFTKGEARTIAPQVDERLKAALKSERKLKSSQEYAQCDGNNDGEVRVARVWFATGRPVSRRSRSKENQLHAAAVRAHDEQLDRQLDCDDPRNELLTFLNSQSQGPLERILRRNWKQVSEAVAALPEDTPPQQRTKEWSGRLLDNLNDYRVLRYRIGARSLRLHARDANILQLPREIRKVALAGAYEMDLCACQLAIVARLWDVEPIQEFLKSGESIWQVLLKHANLGIESKPILKTTLYSLIYGMGKPKLLNQLVQGNGDGAAGIGREKAGRIFAHHFFSALFEARTRVRGKVVAEGGAFDPWGKWEALADFNAIPGKKRPGEPAKPSRPNMRAFLACNVQAYEFRLMSSILPILRSNQQVYLLAWLHDGVTIHFGNTQKRERQIKSLQQCVQREAELFGFHTNLETTLL
jgi:hypothetical protein